MSYYVDPNTQQVYFQAQPGENVTQTVPAQQTSSSFLGLDASSSTFWKGALIGAGLALLVTNETVQKTVVKTVSKGIAAASSGFEELKEKFEDAKAEVEAEASGKTE